MSLLRLLSSGKSLVGVEAFGRKFEMNRRRLLPKFNARKNPFRQTAPASEQPSASHVTSPGAQAAPRAIKSAGTGPAKQAAAWKSWVSVGGSKVKLWAGQCASRMLAWLPRWRKPAKPAIPQFTKPPVQSELRLETIKVLRNDLSDSDLEVVTSKPVKQAAPVAAPADTAAPGQPEESESNWSRIGTRLFGTGKTLT